MKHWMLGMVISFGLGMSASAKGPEQSVDWPAFLAQNDLVWTNGIPDEWGECAFIANGLTGASIYRLPGEEWVLRWELGRTDVATEYVLPNVDWTMPRVPIGNVQLKPRGDVKKATMRLDLWNAEARGVIETSKGVIRWRSFIERETNVLVIDLQATGGERDVELELAEEWGISPRIIDSHTKISEIDPALLPPKPYRKKMGTTTVVVQPLLKTGAHASAFQTLRGHHGHRLFLLSIGKFYEANVSREKSIEKAVDEAVGALRKAQADGLERLEKRHRGWWHTYLKQAWVSLPNDPQWEQFYWLQIYKFGAASRADYPIVMDNVGPWFTQVGWPGTWWNMNVETAYQLQFSGNRMDVGRVLVHALDHFFKTGRFNSREVPDAICLTRSTGYNMLDAPGTTYELGNMAWMLHSYWKYWRYSMDEQVGRNLFPMLKANINYYLGVMNRDDQGRIHLPPSVSPEYSNDRYKDTNYSLQTFDWLLRTALDFNQRFHFNDPAAKTWQNALDHLRRFPEDETGLMIAEGVPYAYSHRHYSHLLALYPLHTINPDMGEVATTLFKKSVDHWWSMTQSLLAYSCTGGACMYATLGDGDTALEKLDRMLGNNYHFGQPRPHNKMGVTWNTMYLEGGGPVIESPLSAVESIDYMMLQSWGNAIRVFPAMPSAWPDAEFHHLRTEGAFLVSARWEADKTQWIRIQSLAGSPLLLQTDLENPIITEGAPCLIEPIQGPQGQVRWKISLKKGETILLQNQNK